MQPPVTQPDSSASPAAGAKRHPGPRRSATPAWSPAAPRLSGLGVLSAPRLLRPACAGGSGNGVQPQGQPRVRLFQPAKFLIKNKIALKLIF